MMSEAAFNHYEPMAVWPDIAIANGAIKLTENCHPGHLLHEAGHLAIAPSELRLSLSGDLNFELPDACDERWMHMTDSAASVWAYFAAKAARVPTRLPFEVGFTPGFPLALSQDGIELHDQIESSIGSITGSPGSCDLFYSGMMASKGAGQLSRFLQV